LAFLKSRFKAWQEQQGIYIVEGEVYPTQVIVGAELSRENNFWLANLRNDLTADQLAQVLTVAVDKSETDAYIHAIINANRETLEELHMRRKKGVVLTEKLDAAFFEKYGAPSKAETVMVVLRARFSRVPKEVERTIRQIADPIALDSWAAQAATCQSMDEFAKALT
jgi:50S ribosomal subunit-associated GTPase HflX